MRRLAYDYLRAHLQPRPEGGKDPSGEDPKGSEPPGSALEGMEVLIIRERRHAIREALQNLSPRDRELIERKHSEEQSYKEIAKAMHLTVNNIGVALSRAEKRLRQILRKRYPALFGEEQERMGDKV